MTDLEVAAAPEADAHEPATAQRIEQDPELGTVQEVLAALPGSVVYLRPVRAGGARSEVLDFRLLAASPGAVDIGGRRGAELIGTSLRRTYPSVVGSELWQGYLTALQGTPYEGELEYQEAAAGIPHLSRYRVRAVPGRGGLIVSWERLDSGERERRRLTLAQQLGRLGWVDRDLVRGGTTWSEEVYSIFDRDRALGPLGLDELLALADGEDRPELADELRRLLTAGEPIDRTFRVRLPHQVRHVRIVAETEADTHGRPVQLHGLVQDLTAAKQTEELLVEQRRAVLSQQTLLAAERDLAARLQRTILPVPEQVLRLADLTVDIAYRPVQQGLKLGGDWYSAIELPDGTVLLVVGDVAGHGLDAVATMAQLRFTAKGMAITGTPLPEVLANLNTLLLHSPERHCNTATMVMAVYEPATSRLTWVRAGHPPPLLLRDGRAEFLPAPEGILLGAGTDPVYRAATLDLHPGDHLLLYTDGLIENPGEPINDGLARLARAAAEQQPRGPRFVDALVHALTSARTRRDDICALHISR
ncbi:PP2C family protein-serine/threonine phosphatase [Kitasatospora sp. NPDC096147]|uniref:PP2C family protein-serine/threonine phosphatase n=1 Tax=Kitasatospora sp. NPDC096147 TaxID=3364093 RepID=UPI00380A299A